eukprot:TRINITY_DN11482_c0_g1_i2.p1 TRINITY_DN11482_c0_g1~~TRINITY_DN11482_c0_g1_i2.p1  ORF type:complete len:296 (+),score=34.23 TRINITY_DN11482_c0_g1_i2:56-943(+)
MEETLPTELIMHILTFLDPLSLCRCSQISRSFMVVCDDDGPWRTLCKAEWRNKQVFHGIEYPFTNWKHSYTTSLVCSKSTTITAHELCSSVWKFRFTEITGGDLNMEIIDVRFHPGHLTVTGYPPLSWRIEGSLILIDDFPPHHITRNLHDWGYVMQNSHVVFWTVDTELFNKAVKWKDEGNVAFRGRNLEEARNCYLKALEIVRGRETWDRPFKFATNGRYGLMTEEERRLRVSVLSNLAQVYFLLGFWGQSIRLSHKVLRMESHFQSFPELKEKCQLRIGEALQAKRNTEDQK